MLVSLLILALILIIVGILLLGVSLLMMGLMLLKPPRMTDGKAAYVLKRLSPGDLGLAFEETRFDIRDEQTGQALPIAAWWIPHAAAQGKCVVLIHGYADGKVGAIAWAPLWHELGYNILAIDLRAHGYSGGKYTTAGFYERHDLNGVLNQLLIERPEDTRQVVLFGVSLGAAVALATAEMRDDIAALVLECPYGKYLHGVQTHAQVMQMPLPGLAPLAVKIAEWISAADFQLASPVELLERVEVPALVIHGVADLFVPRSDAEAIDRVMRQRAARGIISHYWDIDGAAHVMGIVADAGAYRARIRQFLGEIESNNYSVGNSVTRKLVQP